MRRGTLAFLFAVPLLALGCRSGSQVREHSVGSSSGAEALGFGELADQVLYLVMVDRFQDGDEESFPGRDASDPLAFHGGDLAGLESRLGYLADLGVTGLWLTPLHRQIDDAVGPAEERHWPFHGYWPAEHAAIDRRFGDDEGFARVVREAHRRDLRVMLDVVTNHFGYGARAARGPLTRECDRGDERDESPDELRQCLFGLPDLRSEDPAVRRFIVDETVWWSRFGVDGLRFDAAKHVEPELLADIRRAYAARAPSSGALLTVAEHWGATPGDRHVRRYVEAGAADTLFDFSFSGLVEGFLTGRMRAEALAHHLERWHAAEGPPLVHSLNTHDTSTLLFRLGDARARYPLAPFLQLSTFGVPLLAWGDELGRGGGDWPDNRASMPWHRLDDDDGAALHATWRALLRQRRASPSLRGRSFRVLLAVTGERSSSLAYLRGDDRVVIVHRGEREQRVLEGLPPNAALTACVSVGPWEASPQTGGDGRLLLSAPPDAAALFAVAPAACDDDPPRASGR